jgi:hypothetical protein
MAGLAPWLSGSTFVDAAYSASVPETNGNQRHAPSRYSIPHHPEAFLLLRLAQGTLTAIQKRDCLRQMGPCPPMPLRATGHCSGHNLRSFKFNDRQALQCDNSGPDSFAQPRA